MIKKILKIKNFGKFISPVFGGENWNGILEQKNIIYANNGSGKTSLSILFRSLKGSNDLVLRKKSFSATENPEIILLNDENKEVKFSRNKWNKFENDIEIFDSFFIEENIYIITLKNEGESSHVFEILLGDENIRVKKQIEELNVTLKKLRNKRTNLRNKRNAAENEEIRKKYEMLVIENGNEKTNVHKQISNLEDELIKLSSEHLNIYLEKINEYLRLFNPSLKLSKLNRFKNQVVYNLHINGHALKTDEKSIYSLRYALSDGDKNALALSFFLAKIDLLDTTRLTVIIDDPITSFDYFRKSTTINKLINLSNKTRLFVLLTHDLTFANDISRKLNYACNNLKIEFNGTTSYFTKHDIEIESLTGVFKDLTVLHEYLANGASNDIERRDVARCIRPVLEGIFRIKFFREIQRTEWLGDILGKIRDSEAPSIFEPFKKLIPELSEINDYSKEYHHSNPYYFETPINDEELRNYVRRTVELLRVI